MSETSPMLGMPYLQPAQAQKHVTHNEALQLLDTAVQLSVDALETSAPPLAPSDSERYLVGAAATGEWAGHEHEVAVHSVDGWRFYRPALGWIAHVRSAGTFAVFDGAAWTELSPPDPATLGLNATADSQNRLVVAAEGTLLTHDGGDHRLRLNKAATDNTASLLFQTAFDGHAEMGLAGDDAFSVKVSVDGVNWVTVMRFDPVTASVSGSAVQQDEMDATPGRLMLAQHGVLRSDILGAVSQSAGQPTGAIIERSATPTGHVVKWADGTIMMTRTVTVDLNTADSQEFSYPDTVVTVLGGGFIGGDVSDSTGVGSVPRREGLASLAVWTDSTGWRVRLPRAIDNYTISVTLTVFGLWF